MIPPTPINSSKFFVTGINYKKTDASRRGDYAINQEQYAQLFELAPAFNIQSFFVLSTCNRTEIYGFAEDAGSLSGLLCTQTQGELVGFRDMAYIKKGDAAIQHLLEVGAGLDSQILGDYEIVGQIKQAVKFSKLHHGIDAFMERLVNVVLQSSKEIKNTTILSGGTVSVSFAAVQYIKNHIPLITDKKILLIGTGKIGANTCKNLVDYLGTKNITLINRTEEKAANLSKSLGLNFAPAEKLPELLKTADIVLVATNACTPVILKSQVEFSSPKLIIDLSVPCNVEDAARTLPHIRFVNVDDLSRIKDETLQKRQAAVPVAKEIIAKHFSEFLDWQNRRRHVPVLKAVKIKLEQLLPVDVDTDYTAQKILTPTLQEKNQVKIQKIINGMAVKMQVQNQPGCYYIEAINEYFAPGTN